MNPERRPLPEYFRKKKDNQKRRRLERWTLIESNKETLLEIFGKVIFSKGWPVSRRDIKLALGLNPDNDEDDENREAFGEFMEMAEKEAQDSFKRKSKVAKDMPHSRPSKKVHKDVSAPKTKRPTSTRRKK